MTTESSGPIGGADARRTYADLLAIVDSVVSLQPEIELIMRTCLSKGAKGAPLARQAARLTSTLIVLIDRSEALPATLLVDEARGLLRYHHRLLAETAARAPSSATISVTRLDGCNGFGRCWRDISAGMSCCGLPSRPS
jgi:hypothetical protein